LSRLKLNIPSAFAFLFTPKRYKVAYGGRGGAKSVSFGQALLAKGMQTKMLILCCREYQVSISDSVHRLLAEIIENEGMADFYEVQKTTIKGKNGTEFIFKGLKHNIAEIKGLQGVDVAWADEAENVSDRSWELLIPTIRKDGSEIWVTFNTKNISDPTYQRFVAKQADDMICVKVSWRDNPFFPTVLDKERLKLKEQDEEAYAHIWEGEPDTRRSGAVYAKQLAQARTDGRITLVPYDPIAEVFTAWDLGFGDSTVIWWLQFVGRELRWLDCYDNSGQQLDHYAQVVKSKPYNYMNYGHFLPHDADHGNIRGGSVSNQLTTMGLRNTVLEREQDINSGIELLRQTIAYSVFDATKTKDGVYALENYGYEWDEDRGMFKNKPKHDWASHYADGARYAAIAASRVKVGLSRATNNLVTYAATGYY